MFREIKENWLIFILVLSFLAVKFFFLLKPHLVGWDEAVYLGMGKYIWSWGQVGIWENIRPMGLPLLLGFFWKLNLNYFFWAEILANLFSVGSLVIVYFIGKELHSKHLGLGAALTLAITPIFFSQSSLIMTHIPATFFALVAVYFYLLKKSFVWAGLFTVLAFLFRFTQGLLVLIFLLIILFREKEKARKLIGFSAGFLILLLPFLLTNHFLYAGQTSNIFDAALQPVILGSLHSGNPFNPGDGLFYGENLLKQNYLLIFVLFGLVFFAKGYAKNKKWQLTFLAGLVYLAYFSYIPNKQLRFALDFLPYLVLLAALGFYEFYTLVKGKNIVKSLAVLVTALFFIFSFQVMIKTNYQDYQWRSEEEHLLVQTYTYASQLREPIITTNPIPAAYTDKLFISCYDDPLTALKIYDKEKNNSVDVIYFEPYYPCFYEGCFQLKLSLFNLIKKEKKLIAQTSVAGQDFYFFT